MLFVYVDMRYLRQLNRICPDVPASFFKDANASAAGNGGRSLKLTAGTAWLFDDQSVGYSFSASRFLSDVRALLEEHRDRIRECLVLVDVIDAPITSDSISDYLSRVEMLIFPDVGVLLSNAAVNILGSYISVIDQKGSSFYLFAGLRQAEYFEPGESEQLDVEPRLVLYCRPDRHPLFSLRDMISSFSPPDTSSLSLEDSARFTESSAAIQAFATRRFDTEIPEYLLSSFLTWLSLLLKMMSIALEDVLTIRVFGAECRDLEIQDLLQNLCPECAFIAMPAHSYLPADNRNMPDDLAELAWLIYRAYSCLFIDELPEFLLFLGKDSSFLEPLGTLLYSAGFLADSKNFHTLNRAFSLKLEKRLGNRQIELDRTLASFLWKKYERGELQPNQSFSAVLENLSFSVTDTFLVSCLFEERDISPPDQSKLKTCSFSSNDVSSAVGTFIKATEAYHNQKIDNSAILAREALHGFQKTSVLTGEYRALSLIALLSLAQKKADDAIVYLEYALENAERMHEPMAVLRSKFDTAMVYLVMGNYYVALCVLDSLVKPVNEWFAKDIEVLVRFMKGRVHFELGAYRKAENLFQTALDLAELHGLVQMKPLCQVWYARAIMHQNRFASAEGLLVSNLEIITDASVFLMEAALLSGRPFQGFIPTEHLYSRNSDKKRDESFSIFNFSWDSGFIPAEDRCYCDAGERQVLERMHEVYRSVWVFRFVTPGDPQSLAALAREASEAMDPWAAAYFYLAWDFAIRSGTVADADMSVWLSRAFKYMQKRATAISDNAMREDFMKNPTFNSRLWRVARESMLI